MLILNTTYFDKQTSHHEAFECLDWLEQQAQFSAMPIANLLKQADILQPLKQAFEELQMQSNDDASIHEASRVYNAIRKALADQRKVFTDYYAELNLALPDVLEHKFKDLYDTEQAAWAAAIEKWQKTQPLKNRAVEKMIEYGSTLQKRAHAIAACDNSTKTFEKLNQLGQALFCNWEPVRDYRSSRNSK